MLILYSKATCPFCQKVIAYFNDKGVEFEERDIYENEAWMEELLQAGGKRQVPFLVDTETGTSMYESGDIIDYVQTRGGE